MNNLTLIIPAKKEAESLPVFLKEIEDYTCRKLVVLQREDLETKDSIKGIAKVDIYEQKQNGYGNALIEGIRNVNTEFCCIINADGSMDPKFLKEMIDLCNNKDFIFGSRYQKPGGGSDDDDIITYVGNYFFTFLGNFLFKLNVSDILYTYILGKSASFKKLDLKNYDFRICVEIPIKAKSKKMVFSCTPSYERQRIGGKKKVNALKDGLLILSEIVKYFFRIKK